MGKVLLVACDDHSKTMVLRVGVDREEAQTWRMERTKGGRAQLWAKLKEWARGRGAERTVLVYEASGQGFGLHDEARQRGVEAHVLAPSKLARSPQQRKLKDDEKDSQLLYEIVRGHVLGGNALPAVYVPPVALREDREVVRAWMSLGAKVQTTKVEVQALLRRHELKWDRAGGAWSKGHREWLKGLAEGAVVGLGKGTQVALGTLLRQLAGEEAEEGRMEAAVKALAAEGRYQKVVQRLDAKVGVGVMTAMGFLTEVGPPKRFGNRRKMGAGLGLAPSAYESGEAGERKGHITRNGSPRLRKLLCQATWCRVRLGTGDAAGDAACYRRIVARNPKKKKIAVVACMRRLGVQMWHEVVEALKGVPEIWPADPWCAAAGTSRGTARRATATG